MDVKKFEREYIIRSYECDKNNRLRLVTLMNIFQDMADSNAEQMGLGLTFCREHGLAWVGSNYKIVIEQLPQLHEKIKIVTWPAVEKKLGAIRDFMVVNEKGETIIRATSQWILINFTKKRPVSLRDNIPDYNAIDERILAEEFNEKMTDLERIDCKAEFVARFDDIDINNHVNNAVYPLWASESVEKDFRENHMVQEVEIAFKKECHWGEKVLVETQISGSHTLHSIKSLTDERELARVKIIWQAL